MKKFEIILNDIIEKIHTGDYRKGDKLPSLRYLAKKYSCNRDTVIKALAELKSRHILYSIEKSGHFILTEIKKKQGETDFENSLPDYLQFPFGDFMTCMNEVLTLKNSDLFNYYPRQTGLDELINSVYFLLKKYSVHGEKEQITITSGTQQALYVLANIEIKKGKDIILLEEPSYHRMNSLIKSLGLKYRTIKRSLEGIDLIELESLFKSGNIKFFYTVPRLHNPLGTSLKEKTKKAIVNLAKKYKVYIIEDDYMADFDTGFSSPLYYYDIDEMVIYIKSFSSIIFPAIRISAVVLPKAIKGEFLKLKNLMDYDTNLIVQKALSLYIDNGMFEKHKNRLISLYDEKAHILKKTLSSSPIIKYFVFDTKALFILRENISINELKNTLGKKYKVDFMEKYYIKKCPYEYLKIDVRNMNLADIEKNVSELAEILKDYI